MLHLKERLGDEMSISKCNKRTSNFMDKPFIKSTRSRLDKDRQLGETGRKWWEITDCRTKISLQRVRTGLDRL